MREMTREEKKKVIQIIIILMIVLVFSAIFKISGDKDKQYDRKIWQPWLELPVSEIKTIKLEPFIDRGYQTIPGTIEITDRELIRKLKENLSRKPMSEDDKIGYHWFSRRHICLKVYSDKEDYAFLLFLHDEFPSIEYQMLKKNGICSRSQTIGRGWRSAELYEIVNEIIASRKMSWHMNE
jgi:hypothetical protein